MTNQFSVAKRRIQRSPYQAISAISIMTMTLFLACAFFLVAAGSQAVLRYFETRPQVNAFFKHDVVPDPAQIDVIKSKLNSTGHVESVKYVSKEEALIIYKDLNKNDPLLLEAVTANMLPASVEVSATDPKYLKDLAEILKKEEGIDDVRFAEDIISALSTWTNSVRIIGLSLVGAHIFIAFTTIILIVGTKVAARREEITLLQLVGATRGFISAPFVWEGVIYGVIGGFLAWGIAYLILLYSMGFLVGFLAGIPILPPPILFMFEVLLGNMILGSVIGAFGGWLAVKRFLKS